MAHPGAVRPRIPITLCRPRPLLRPVSLIVSGLGLPALAVAWCGPPVAAVVSALTGGSLLSSLPLELLVTALAAVSLAGCAAWLALVLVATAVEAVTGRSCATVRSVTPAFVRRTALVACGVAVAGAGALGPAAATAPEREVWSATDAHAITGLPLPDRATGVPPTTSPTGGPGPGRGHRTHRVRPGESLWSIAESLTRPGSGAGTVAAGCRRLYRANLAVVGPDPDLIVPGTILLVHERHPAGKQAAPPTRHRKDAS